MMTAHSFLIPHDFLGLLINRVYAENLATYEFNFRRNSLNTSPIIAQSFILIEILRNLWQKYYIRNIILMIFKVSQYNPPLTLSVYAKHNVLVISGRQRVALKDGAMIFVFVLNNSAHSIK